MSTTKGLASWKTTGEPCIPGQVNAMYMGVSVSSMEGFVTDRTCAIQLSSLVTSLYTWLDLNDNRLIAWHAWNRVSTSGGGFSTSNNQPSYRG